MPQIDNKYGVRKMNIFIKKGETIPEIQVESNIKYGVRLNDKLVISPLPFRFVLKKIEDFSYLSNSDFKKIYDSEKGIALEDFVIEEFVR